MGGKMFVGSCPVQLSELEQEWSKIVDILTSCGCGRIAPIGSTFLKTTMGDVDVAVEHNDKNELFEKLSKHRNVSQIGVIGGQTISFLYKKMQIDVTVGDIQFLQFARKGTQNTIKQSIHYSKFKGTLRQVLFNSILKTTSAQLFPTTELDRECYSLDLDQGLFIAKQTKRGAKDNVLKKWKTTERSFITRDPFSILDIIYQKCCLYIPQTFEQAFQAIKFKSSYKEIKHNFLQDYDEINHNAPERIQHDVSNPVNIREYIKKIEYD